MPAVPREQFRFSRLGWIWMFVEVFRTTSLWPGPTRVAGAVLLTTCSLSFPGHRCRAGRVCNLSLSTTICHTSGGKCFCRQVSQLRPPLCMTKEDTPQIMFTSPRNVCLRALSWPTHHTYRHRCHSWIWTRSCVFEPLYGDSWKALAKVSRPLHLCPSRSTRQ